jgi:hypothetical protein
MKLVMPFDLQIPGILIMWAFNTTEISTVMPNIKTYKEKKMSVQRS